MTRETERPHWARGTRANHRPAAPLDRERAQGDMHASGAARPVAVAPFAGFGPTVRALAAPLARTTRAEAQIEARRGYAREASEATRAERIARYARDDAQRRAYQRAVWGGVYAGD